MRYSLVDNAANLIKSSWKGQSWLYWLASYLKRTNDFVFLAYSPILAYQSQKTKIEKKSETTIGESMFKKKKKNYSIIFWRKFPRFFFWKLMIGIKNLSHDGKVAKTPLNTRWGCCQNNKSNLWRHYNVKQCLFYIYYCSYSCTLTLGVSLLAGRKRRWGLIKPLAGVVPWNSNNVVVLMGHPQVSLKV